MSLTIRGAKYRYPGGKVDAVNGVDLDIHPGEFVLLTGPTGCGKSTLIRLAGGLLQRHGAGDLTGEIRVDTYAPGDLVPSQRVKHIAYVSQKPQDQLVAGTVGDEVAFGLESAGWTASEIEKQIPMVLQQVALDVPLDHPCLALSGGQMQRLVVAAAIAGGAPLLLLDEPLSQIDRHGAVQLMEVLTQLAKQGTSILMVEHRVSTVMDSVDRMLVMANGALLGEGKEWLKEVGLDQPLPAGAPVSTLGPVLLEGADLSYRWPGATSNALDKVNIRVSGGERIAIMGPNGSGKSTLIQGLAGHLPIGKIVGDTLIVDVPQDPDLALFCATTHAELMYGPKESKIDPVEAEKRVAKAAKGLDLEELLSRPPQALSRGQRLRTAVAAAMCCDPSVLLLDEPTSGQDRTQVARMMTMLGDRGAERGLVFATHDVELVRLHATRVIWIEDGKIGRQGTPAEVLP